MLTGARADDRVREFEKARGAASIYVEGLLKQDERIDTVLLGCTHYALIERVIRELVPAQIQVVSQGTIVALKLADYLRRHPEMETRLDRAGTQSFLTTSTPTAFNGWVLSSSAVRL